MAPQPESTHDSALILNRASKIVVATSCVLFLVCGMVVLPYPGIQNDEALFAAPLFFPKSSTASVSLSNYRVPIMQMTYLGCLKAWIFKAIFAVWSPSIYSMRLPVLLLGTITIYLFWLLVRWTVGDCAAILAVILLATDTSFLLTTCFDWGPVALQHLLTVGGVLALLVFYRSGKEWFLGLGFFLFGLALWDKAIFSWSLAGLVIAGLLLFPRELGKLASGRRVLIALLFLAIGASPLLWYNLVQGGRTFGSNASLSIRELPTKLVALRKTVDGSMFFEFFVANSSTGSGPARETLLRRSAVAVWRVVPIHRNANEFSFLLAVALVPFLWRTTARKTLLFTLCLIAIIWFQMAVTIGAGTGPHHAVLIWPWPMFFIGVAYSEASLKLRSARTVVLPLLIGLLAAANVLLSNSYLAELIHNGPGPGWTDAIFPLADYLKSHSSVEVYSTDWGTTHSLRLLDRGTLRLQDATFTILKDRPDPGDTQFLCSMITRRDDLLISHTAGFEAFKGINARLAAIAARMGYRQHVITTISDHENRNVFEVFRFEKEK